MSTHGVKVTGELNTLSLRHFFQKKEDLFFLGLAFPQAWLEYMFFSLNAYAPLSVEVFYATRGIFVAAIAVIFYVRKSAYGVTWSGLSWPITFLMTIAPFLIILELPISGLTVGILAAIFGGIGIVWSYLPHIHVYSKLDPIRIAAYVLISFSVASLIRVPINLLPIEVAYIITAPFPFLGIYFARKALQRVDAVADHCVPLTNENLRSLVPVALELALYGIVVGITRFSTEGQQYEMFANTMHLAFRFAFPLILLWWITARRRNLSISRLCQIALLFIITTLLAISVFGGTGSQLAVGLGYCTRTAIIFLLWLVLALLAHRSRLHPYVVFGVGWSLYMLSIVAGMLVAEHVGNGIFLTDSLVLHMVYLLVVTTVFILFRSDKLVDLLPEKEKSTAPKSDFELIMQRCREIGNERGLSKREVDVMQLLCLGRSKRHIAEALHISEHTVKGYAKSLYAKLEVHSKEELLDLIEVP